MPSYILSKCELSLHCGWAMSNITDKNPPWSKYVMVGICWVTMMALLVITRRRLGTEIIQMRSVHALWAVVFLLLCISYIVCQCGPKISLITWPRKLPRRYCLFCLACTDTTRRYWPGYKTQISATTFLCSQQPSNMPLQCTCCAVTISGLDSPAANERNQDPVKYIVADLLNSDGIRICGIIFVDAFFKITEPLGPL